MMQTNTLPTLLPPFGELPPTFWEQHATFTVLGGIGIIALLAFALWLLVRPKPAVVIPPEAQAWRTLAALRQQPEDGAVLSLISQAVRNYFIAAFRLPPGEFTTAEFSRLILGHELMGRELATATAALLRDCDERKFSTVPAPMPMNAAEQALQLIAQAEQRRAQLRQPAKTLNEGRRA